METPPGAKHHNAWSAAVEVIEEAAKSSDDDSVSRSLLFEAAAISIKYAKDYVKAADIYNQFLESDPEDEEVKRAMLDLLRAEGRYEELIADLASRAESAENQEVRLGLIKEIAEIYDSKLKESGMPSICLMKKTPSTCCRRSKINPPSRSALPAMILYWELRITITPIEYIQHMMSPSLYVPMIQEFPEII